MHLSQLSALGLLTNCILASNISPHPASAEQQQQLLDLDHNDTAYPSPSDADLDDIISSSPLLSFHRALVETSSVSDNESSVADYVVSFLKSHNFTVTTQDVPDINNSSSFSHKRKNIFAVPDSSVYGAASSSGKKDDPIEVLLSSHIDTVPPFIPYKLIPPNTTDAFNSSDLTIFGRGTVDDKACVATQLFAILSLLASPDHHISPTSLALLFVVGEEYGGDGMRHFSDSPLNEKSSATWQTILFGEPTESKLTTGHKGMVRARLVARGKAAHSGYPWLGKSANSIMLKALSILDGLGDLPEDKGGLPRSEKYGKSTVNIGLVRGGVAANVVPEYAEAEVLMRLAGGTRDSAVEIVRRALEDGGVDLDGDVEVDFSWGYGPVELDSDVEGFETIVVNYGTDVPNLKIRKGVKKYLYGPGSILVAHGANEALTVGAMEGAVEGYKRLILKGLESKK